MEKKARTQGIDAIKVLASFFVVAIHSFYHAGYYSTALVGTSVFFWSALRFVYNTCVPLFFMATGFLAMRTHVSWSYYQKIIRLLVEYVIIMVITALVYHLLYQTPLEWQVVLKNIVRMNDFLIHYLVLFAFLPFLNGGYNAIASKQEKLVLMGLLITVSGGMGILANVFGSSAFGWAILYPIAYFMIGKFIREYEPRFSSKLLGFLLFDSVLLQTIILFVLAPRFSGTFAYFTGGYESIFIAFSTCCLFLMLYHRKVHANWIQKGLEQVSGVTFSIFLFSILFDNVLWNAIGSSKDFTAEALNMVWVVPLSFALALGSSLLLKQTLDCFVRLKRPKAVQLQPQSN